jgi:hypothetical protein
MITTPGGFSLCADGTDGPERDSIDPNSFTNRVLAKEQLIDDRLANDSHFGAGALLVGAERAPIFDLPVPGLQIGIVYSVDGAKPVGIAKDYLPGGGSWSSPWKSQIAPAIAAASGITIKTLRMSVFVSNLVCKNYTCNYLKD